MRNAPSAAAPPQATTRHPAHKCHTPDPSVDSQPPFPGQKCVIFHSTSPTEVPLPQPHRILRDAVDSGRSRNHSSHSSSCSPGFPSGYRPPGHTTRPTTTSKEAAGRGQRRSPAAGRRLCLPASPGNGCRWAPSPWQRRRPRPRPERRWRGPARFSRGKVWGRAVRGVHPPGSLRPWGRSILPPGSGIPLASYSSPDPSLCPGAAAMLGAAGSPQGRGLPATVSLRCLSAPPGFTGGSDTPFYLHLKKMLGVVCVCPPARTACNSGINFTRRT